MASLYVSYNAANQSGGHMTGWATVRNTAEPQSTADVEALCAKIAAAEKVQHVVPVWWRSLPSE